MPLGHIVGDLLFNFGSFSTPFLVRRICISATDRPNLGQAKITLDPTTSTVNSLQYRVSSKISHITSFLIILNSMGHGHES